MRKFSLLSLLLGILLVGSTVPLPVVAAPAIQVEGDRVDQSFPTSVTFSLSASSPALIQQVSLRYWTNKTTCLGEPSQRELPIESAARVEVAWKWAFDQPGGLPPGAELVWQWQLQDGSRNLLTTPQQTATIVDSHYQWQALQSGLVSVTWTTGDRNFGETLLEIASDNLARIGKEIGLYPVQHIHILVYPSAEDARQAMVHQPAWIGGAAFPAFHTVLVGITTGQMGWAGRVIPHEMAHLIVGEQTSNCTGNALPAWLNEGIATFAEGPADREDLRLLRAALKSGQAAALRDISTSFPTESQAAALAYTQSGEVIHYLLETYGIEKLSNLLDEIRSGKPADAALQSVYGISTLGLDRAWRQTLLP